MLLLLVFMVLLLGVAVPLIFILFQAVLELGNKFLDWLDAR